MLSPLRALFVFALVPIFAHCQDLSINTPSDAVVCQPLLITWSGGVPPYHLYILPGNQPNAAPLEDLGVQSGTSCTWVVNLAPSTSIGLRLRDSKGAVAESAPFTIQPGPDGSCIKSQ